MNSKTQTLWWSELSRSGSQGEPAALQSGRQRALKADFTEVGDGQLSFVSEVLPGGHAPCRAMGLTS